VWKTSLELGLASVSLLSLFSDAVPRVQRWTMMHENLRKKTIKMFFFKMRACEFIEALLAEKSEHLALRYVHHVFEGLFSINWLAA